MFDATKLSIDTHMYCEACMCVHTLGSVECKRKPYRYTSAGFLGTAETGTKGPGLITVRLSQPRSARRPSEPSLWLVGALVMALTWIVLSLSGCAGGTPPPPGGPVPTGCYAKALAAADMAAAVECGGVWTLCDKRSEILKELDEQLERCDSLMGE